MEWLIAHGIVGRTDLPIPEWLFGWAAAIVLIVSFVALAVLWPEPRLEGDRGGALFTLPGANVVEAVCGAIGVFLFGVTIYAGLAGEQTPSANWAPTFVYVIFWLGFAAASVLLGDVFRAFNPWRAIARGVAGIAKLARGGSLPAPLPYPERLGRWPAAAGLFAFAWMELAATDGDMPRNVAIAALVYSAATWIGMALYGIDRWIERGEAFSVYYNLFSRLSIWERRGRDVGIRRAAVRPRVARAAARHGPAPRRDDRVGHLRRRRRGQVRGWTSRRTSRSSSRTSGLSPETALMVTYTVGLIAAIAIVYGFYRLGIAGARTVGGGFDSRRLGERLRPLARADRVRIRGSALHDAAAVPGPGDLVPRL